MLILNDIQNIPVKVHILQQHVMCLKDRCIFLRNFPQRCLVQNMNLANCLFFRFTKTHHFPGDVLNLFLMNLEYLSLIKNQLTDYNISKNSNSLSSQHSFFSPLFSPRILSNLRSCHALIKHLFRKRCKSFSCFS